VGLFSGLNRSFLALLFLLSFGLLASSQEGNARDMHGRLGLGFNAQFLNDQLQNSSPSISIKYGLTHDLALAAIAGLSTASPVNSVIGGKFLKNLFFERNLNFYFTIGAGIVTGTPHFKKDSKVGFELINGFGAEFFLPSVESIGWSIEAGASLSNHAGSLALRTFGASFLKAGMHFYF
jgi:hypothetical protein